MPLFDLADMKGKKANFLEKARQEEILEKVIKRELIHYESSKYELILREKGQ